MKIIIIGGGPAGLYCGLLLKKARPDYDITIIERNAADVTYGWGVVFSDRTLATFQRADYTTYEQIVAHFVMWDAIDVHYRDEIIRCSGHVIASISRMRLLQLLQSRCAELGVELQFGREINNLDELEGYDLLIGADGINSTARRAHAETFKPTIEMGKARFIWLGADKVLDAFTFIFRENKHGLFQVHAYPSSGTTSTFIVECDEATWQRAGLDKADERESLTYCERLFARDLEGAKLLSNNSKWINFPTLTMKRWHAGRIVLLGDAVHTAHFSIGSGTKLAMEDAIVLVGALEQYADRETALNEFELQRKPVVELFQQAASISQSYFETVKRYMGLQPLPFTFQLLTRSGRITYNDLRLRDSRFVDVVDRGYAEHQTPHSPSILPPELLLPRLFAPPPMFNSLRLRALTIPNRLGLAPLVQGSPSESPEKEHATLPDHGILERKEFLKIYQAAYADAGLILLQRVAVSAQGRITPCCVGMYTALQVEAWAEVVEGVHRFTQAKVAIELNHAGRRGSTRPRSEGLDRPLRQHNWPLLAASAIPYTPSSHVPKAMERADMEQVRQEFVRSTQLACEAEFDALQINMAHGYLLASFLSPLANRREDEYGGCLDKRLRFPLEIFDAVRATWPEEKPLSVALNADDCIKGGLTIEEAIQVARTLKEHGCDIIAVQAGQTIPDGEPAYGKGFLTALSDRIRNEVGIPTLVGGYLTTSDEVNTILAAGRADLCIMAAQPLTEEASSRGG